MTRDPRHIALGILREAAAGRRTLDQALEGHDTEIMGLAPKDRSLCHAIVFGVLRHRGLLDHLIRAFSDRPFDSLDDGVVQVLRLALFQMVYLDRVPDFAAIDTAVELTKKKINRKSGGFVNAVLRQAAREHREIPLPSETGQFSAHLRVAYSIPTWLGSRWTKAYGKPHTLALCQSLMEIPELTLRVNSLKTDRSRLAEMLTRSGHRVEHTRYSPAGLHLAHPGTAVSELPGYSEGFFQVQDEAAQLVSRILNPHPGETILDACAGLGGKTCHMAQLMENSGRIIAADIDGAKSGRLEDEARRLGISIVEGTAMDMTAATVKDIGRYADRVLVDAPCTGLGVIRRNPDTRWKRGHRDILRMAARQKKILNSAASLVVPGGILVYAVCSCEEEENEGVIQHFLDKRKDFSPDGDGMAQAAPGLPFTSPGAAWFKTFPAPGSMDGFFVARLKRKGRP